MKTETKKNVLKYYETIKGKTYKLDNEHLKLTKRYKNGIHVFQVCNKAGVIKEPVRNRDGYIMDHGTRLVFRRLNELIEI